MASMWTLQGSRSDGKYVFQLALQERKELIFGRSAQSPYPLVSLAISRKHFKLVPVGEEDWAIQDLQSSNGTYVNQMKLSPSGCKKLKANDVITVGINKPVPKKNSSSTSSGYTSKTSDPVDKDKFTIRALKSTVDAKTGKVKHSGAVIFVPNYASYNKTSAPRVSRDDLKKWFQNETGDGIRSTINDYKLTANAYVALNIVPDDRIPSHVKTMIETIDDSDEDVFEDEKEDKFFADIKKKQKQAAERIETVTVTTASSDCNSDSIAIEDSDQEAKKKKDAKPKMSKSDAMRNRCQQLKAGLSSSPASAKNKPKAAANDWVKENQERIEKRIQKRNEAVKPDEVSVIPSKRRRKASDDDRSDSENHNDPNPRKKLMASKPGPSSSKFMQIDIMSKSDPKPSGAPRYSSTGPSYSPKSMTGLLKPQPLGTKATSASPTIPKRVSPRSKQLAGPKSRMLGLASNSAAMKEIQRRTVSSSSASSALVNEPKGVQMIDPIGVNRKLTLSRDGVRSEDTSRSDSLRNITRPEDRRALCSEDGQTLSVSSTGKFHFIHLLSPDAMTSCLR